MTVAEQWFQDRVVIVTGGSRGIGRALAQRVVREGGRAVIVARGREQLHYTADELRGLAPNDCVLPIVANVSRDGEHERIVELTRNRYGRIDHLVNGVAVNVHFGPLRSITREAFERILFTNTWSALAMIRAAVDGGLGEDRAGSIVNVSTIGAAQVRTELATYGASKLALESLTRALAREVAPAGIRVNAVAPGLVRTEMARVLWEGDKEQTQAEVIPLGRIGEPDDIAAAIRFLLSVESSWITGVCLTVDGGRLLVGDEIGDLLGARANETSPSM